MVYSMSNVSLTANFFFSLGVVEPVNPSFFFCLVLSILLAAFSRVRAGLVYHHQHEIFLWPAVEKFLVVRSFGSCSPELPEPATRCIDYRYPTSSIDRIYFSLAVLSGYGISKNRYSRKRRGGWDGFLLVIPHVCLPRSATHVPQGGAPPTYPSPLS